MDLLNILEYVIMAQLMIVVWLSLDIIEALCFKGAKAIL